MFKTEKENDRFLPSKILLNHLKNMVIYKV